MTNMSRPVVSCCTQSGLKTIINRGHKRRIRQILDVLHLCLLMSNVDMCEMERDYSSGKLEQLYMSIDYVMSTS